MRRKEAPAMAGKICLSYHKSFWCVAVFFLFVGLGVTPLILLLPSPQPLPISLVLFTFCISQFHTYNAVIMISTLLFHRVEADDAGIRWQTLRGETFRDLE
jgi:hypothetical protein